MGTLRSATDHSGLMVNGIALGKPACDVDLESKPVGEYQWDDSRLPNGEISSDGTITVDESELI
jgi:hypothetical protein